MRLIARSNLWLPGLACLCFLPSQSDAKSDPLFTSDEPLAVTFEMPVKSIVKDADDRPVVDGVMKYRDIDGTEVAIDMTMTTRGRSRLDYCSFPPLKMDLKKGQAKGTLFSGQNKLKIVTHCRKGYVFERYLQQEFGIYKAYNELTDFSFRVRWIKATYRDSAGVEPDEVHDAFFIESDREVGERQGREQVMDSSVPSQNLDPVESSRYALFQFLVANTDWSMIKGPDDEGCCHNGMVLTVPGSTDNWVVLPYDFDQAGLINTKYSMPASGLKISSVTKRLYRGRCRHNGQLSETIKEFNEKRPELERHLVPKELAERDQRKARSYVGAFFDIINDPGKQQRLLYEACVGS